MALISSGSSISGYQNEFRLGFGHPLRNTQRQRGCPRGFVDFSGVNTRSGNWVFDLLKEQASNDPAALAYLIGTMTRLMLEDNGSDYYIEGLEDEARRELEQMKNQ
jgi:hypothetical protein